MAQHECLIDMIKCWRENNESRYFTHIPIIILTSSWFDAGPRELLRLLRVEIHDKEEKKNKQ